MHKQAVQPTACNLSFDPKSAGTMFELVKALNDGAQVLKTRSANPISLNAGCELFIAFVTLFPHDSVSFADLKTKLIRQGQQYAQDALAYRTKIAELAVGFIKDGSVILTHSYSRVVMQTLLLAHQRKRISGLWIFTLRVLFKATQSAYFKFSLPKLVLVVLGQCLE
ncbi:hypothetical protein C0991_008197 [Blastosporella zonata]|nr:hypothetical protein C0991_008197 [Blastosporella zonata]